MVQCCVGSRLGVSVTVNSCELLVKHIVAQRQFHHSVKHAKIIETFGETLSQGIQNHVDIKHSC